MIPYRPVLAFVVATLAINPVAARDRFPLTAALKPVDMSRPSVPDWTLRPGRLVDVGGYRLNIYCMGRGAPTTVLFSGGGWGAIAFSNIQPALSEHGRVCSFDRAGAGFSDLGPLTPDPGQGAREASILLDRAGEKGPFVLAGWSLGGMEARQFAADHPERVAGLVMIDGSPFDEVPLKGDESWYLGSLKLLADCRKDADAGTLRTDPARRSYCARVVNPLDALPQVRAAIGDRVIDPHAYALADYNLRHQPAVFARLRDTRKDFGNLPLRVIVASDHVIAPQPEDKPAALDAISNPALLRFAVKLAGTSQRGKVIIVPGTSHAVHFDRPDEVVATIVDVLDVVRKDKSDRLEAAAISTER